MAGEFGDHTGGGQGGFDELVLVGIEKVGDEPAVLVHDVGPEGHDLVAGELGVAVGDLAEPT